MDKNDYGFEACMESVIFDVERLHQSPITLLGKWTLRAKQDRLFNPTMIEALNAYIDQHGIRWDSINH